MEIYVEMSKSPNRLKERMIWRDLTKSEILEFMRTELRNHKIKSTDSKLKLIRQWIKLGKPDKNMLLNQREKERMRKLRANGYRDVQLFTLARRAMAIFMQTHDISFYDGVTGPCWDR